MTAPSRLESSQQRRFSPLQDVWFPSTLLKQGTLAEYLEFAESLRTRSISEEDWDRYRLRRLREMLEQALSGSSFYRTHLGEISPHNFRLEDLAKLPFTNKPYLNGHGKTMYAQPFSTGGVYFATSDRGEPEAAPRSWLESVAAATNMATNLGDAIARNVLPHEPVAALLFSPGLDGLAETFADAWRSLGVAHARCWLSHETGLNRAREMIEHTGANIIVASTTALADLWVADRASGRPTITKSGQIRLLLVAGREATCSSLLQQLSEAYGDVACFSGAYGGIEMPVAGSTCGFGNKHIAKQNFIAEILDVATGRMAAPGSPGELVLTSLVPGVRPLVRYRTGDVVSLRPSDCLCENKADVMINHGRLADMIFFNGKRWFLRDIEERIVTSTRSLCDFRLFVTKQDAKDVLLIEVEQHAIDGGVQANEAQLTMQLGGAVRFVRKAAPAHILAGHHSRPARVEDRR